MQWKFLILVSEITQIIFFPIIFSYLPSLYIDTAINYIIVGLIFSVIICVSIPFIIGDLEGLLEILNNITLISLPTPSFTQGVFYWLGEIGINPLVLYALIFEFIVCHLIYFIW